jgi:hypothetical protein
MLADIAGHGEWNFYLFWNTLFCTYLNSWSKEKNTFHFTKAGAFSLKLLYNEIIEWQDSKIT